VLPRLKRLLGMVDMTLDKRGKYQRDMDKLYKEYGIPSPNCSYGQPKPKKKVTSKSKRTLKILEEFEEWNDIHTLEQLEKWLDGD